MDQQSVSWEPIIDHVASNGTQPQTRNILGFSASTESLGTVRAVSQQTSRFAAMIIINLKPAAPGQRHCAYAFPSSPTLATLYASQQTSSRRTTWR
jgi:hypothetical protein